MYTPDRSHDRWQTPVADTPESRDQSRAPIYHVYSHYGCRSEDIDRCVMCKYLLQENTHLHSTPQSLVAATSHPVPPTIHRQLSPTPIEPVRQRIDQHNDLYLLQDIPGSKQTRREAEDAAIINICLKDKTIDRIVLADAEEQTDAEDEDVLFVRVHDLEKH